MHNIQSKYLLLFSIAIFGVSDVLQGGTAVKSIVASQVTSAPRIDGLLNDVEWRTAVPVEGFHQFDPDEGAVATERTTVSVLYDDNALYIGVMAYDTDPGGIVRQLTRRDRSTQSDRFSVIIDSYHDHSNAFLFSGSVSGVQLDGILSQDGTVYDVQWDAVWEFEAAVVDQGWSAEFKIPYSALRFSEQDGEYVWGVNFRRFIARKKEVAEWVLVRREDASALTISSVSRMGHLSGLRNIHPPQHLALLAYQVSKHGFLSQQPPFPLRSEFRGTAGFDLKYGITNTFTLDMAVNPDFGQVEVDQSVLNLTVFETFYPEKRPFFLEASQFFSFGTMFDNSQLRLLYSRRIGAEPSEPPLDAGFVLIERPQVTKILGASKLTGKSADGLIMGLLSSLTDRESGVEQDLLGNKRSLSFASRASQNVVRLKQDVLSNSWVGMMATGLFNEERAPVLSGGVDWNVREGEDGYAVDGYLAGSRLTTPMAEEISGGAGRFGIGKLEGLHWLAYSTYEFSTPNFYIEDLGFYSQPREHGGYSQISFKEDHAGDPLRRVFLTSVLIYRWNWDRINTWKQLETEANLEFRNFWNVSLNHKHEFPAFDDASRGIVGLYLRPAADRISATISTDSRQILLATWSSWYQHSAYGSNTFATSFYFTFRPSSSMEFSPAFTLSRTRNEEAWPLYYYTGNGRNLFGDRDVDQFDFSLRGTMTFTRSISLQFFTQILLAKGQYQNFKELVGSSELLPYVYSTASGNPDFNEQILNANVVFRWEYLPGSSFYLVWTQSRYGVNSFYERPLSDNFSETFRLPMDNVILAKISYWWSL